MRVAEARERKADVLTALGAVVERHPNDVVAVGLCGLGAGEYGLAVRYATDTPLSRALIDQVHALVGAACEIREVGQVHALQWEPDELRQQVRPLRPGLSVAHAAVTAGTLGAFVMRRDADLASDGDGTDDPPVHVLSNNHVLADSDRAQAGEVVLQPGPADGGRVPADQIGMLDRVVPMSRDVANTVDAATAVLDAGVDIEPAHPAGLLAGWAEADLGLRVEKAGRTTGLTRGHITAIEIDGLIVQYPVGVISFDGQIEVSGDGAGPFSAGGDSGSVVYDPESRNAVGLLFAGSERGGPGGFGLTYCNPFGPVLELLDVQLLADVSADAARVAKDAVAEQVADDPRVNGVGLTRWHGRYAVQVTVAESGDAPVLPRRIYGVAVRVVAVGRITPRPHG